jgi:hypothetical protein
MLHAHASRQDVLSIRDDDLPNLLLPEQQTGRDKLEFTDPEQVIAILRTAECE